MRRRARWYDNEMRSSGLRSSTLVWKRGWLRSLFAIIFEESTVPRSDSRLYTFENSENKTEHMVSQINSREHRDRRVQMKLSFRRSAQNLSEGKCGRYIRSVNATTRQARNQMRETRCLAGDNELRECVITTMWLLRGTSCTCDSENHVSNFRACGDKPARS